MIKHISFFVAVAFFLATIKTSMCKIKREELKRDLVVQLTPEEQKTYQEIIDMRRNIYFQGLILGVVVSLIYLRIHTVDNPQIRISTAVALTGTINYFYYILYPKDKYMLEYLDSKRENKAWLKIYKTMQYRYHSAFFLGLVGSYFLSYHFA